MTLKVSTRIAGGFGVVVVLLLVIGITSFNAVRSIHDNLSSVVDEATPMLLSSGELISALLESINYVNQHQKYNNLQQLGQFEEHFHHLEKKFNDQVVKMEQLVQARKNISALFKESMKKNHEYFNIVPEIFADHRQDIETGAKVVSMKSDFEDVADELDSLLYDYSEEVTEQQQKETLQALSNLIREGTISTVDALNIDVIGTIETARKDLAAINKTINIKFESLSKTEAAELSYYSQLS